MPALDANNAIAANAIPIVRFIEHLPDSKTCIARTNGSGLDSGIAHPERHV
jgi:hypothetical protein